MNVATLHLCKELYELSGWLGDGWYIEDKYGVIKEPDQLEEGWCNDFPTYVAPGYDLGYLLRKLAENSATPTAVRFVDPNNHLSIDLQEWLDRWIAYTPSMEQRIYPYADSPEDAACKLAIELFKQGILTMETTA